MGVAIHKDKLYQIRLHGPCKEMINSIKERVKKDVARCLVPEAVDYAFARFAMWYIIGQTKYLDEIRKDYEYLEIMLKIFDENCYRASYNISPRLLTDHRYDLLFDFVRLSRGRYDEHVCFDPENHYALTYTGHKRLCDFLADSDDSVLFFHDPRACLVQAVGLTLARIQMIRDLETVEDSRPIVGQFVPQEILTMILSETTSSSFIANNRRVLEAEDHSEIIESLLEQIESLYRSIDDHYPYFWPCLVYGENPSTVEWFDLFPCATAHMVVQHMGELWMKVPGALDLIADCMSKSSSSYWGWKIRDQFVPEGIEPVCFSRTGDFFRDSEWPQKQNMPPLDENCWPLKD